jgi:hypothetical protein
MTLREQCEAVLIKAKPEAIPSNFMKPFGKVKLEAK